MDDVTRRRAMKLAATAKAVAAGAAALSGEAGAQEGRGQAMELGREESITFNLARGERFAGGRSETGRP